MPKAPQTPKDHYKVRVVFSGGMVHLASWDEPKVRSVTRREGLEFWDDTEVDADWIDNPAYGDTLGDIDWHKAVAITWRFRAGSGD